MTTRTPYTPEDDALEALRAENAWLRERLEMLTGGSLTHDVFRHDLGFTPQQASLLALLYNKIGRISHDAIYANVFQRDDGEGPYDNIIKVLICRIRAKLRAKDAPHGINNKWGHGYEMTPELRLWLSGFIPVEDKYELDA